MQVLVVSYTPGSYLLETLEVLTPPGGGEVLVLADDRRVRVLHAVPLEAVQGVAYTLLVDELSREAPSTVAAGGRQVPAPPTGPRVA
ncbi:hypothetical protein ACFPTY_07200 [Halomonas beimenensis]|uniref:Uncharacterized protein n=1 Tax=Halomonas beimenensis TaxID=475662 RepID=A0A291P7B9_9GAMM|nr:hypothetical protein [Halomonas beimenensis]ATJ82768.1 hypothetical protein BEI_1781 [Halomonas beimenensis]